MENNILVACVVHERANKATSVFTEKLLNIETYLLYSFSVEPEE